MVQRLSIALTLTGVEEIGKQLLNLGNVGALAFAGMARGAEKATKEIANLPPQLQKVEQSFNNLQRSAAATLAKIGDFKVGNLATAFGQVESAAGSMITRLALIAGATAAAGAGLVSLVNSAANAADNMQEMAAGAGVSAEAFQALSNAAADSGVEPEKLAQAMGLLSKALTEQDLKNTAARFGTLKDQAAAAAGPLARLGISTRDAMGNLKGADQVLLQVADAFQQMPDGANKTAIALELFGRGGRKMVDFLNKGSAGIKELAAAMAVTGFTAEQFKVGDKFAQQMLIMTTALTGVKNQIGIAFAPAVGGVVAAFTERILKNFGDFRVRLAAIAEAIKPIFADIANAIRGGEGPKTEIGAALIAGFDRLKGTAAQAGEIVAGAFGLMRSAAAGAAGVINGVFGTNFSGDALLAATAILKITGALSLMTASVGLAASALSLLGSAFGLVVRGAIALGTALAAAFAVPAASLIVPILAALALIAVAFIATSETAQSILGQMFVGLVDIAAAGGKKVVDAIVASLSIPGTEGIFDWIVKAIDKVAEDVIQRMINVRIRIGEILSGDFSGVFAARPLAQSMSKQFDDIFKQVDDAQQRIQKQLGIEVPPPDTKKAESAWDKLFAFIKILSTGTLAELEKMFPGITDAVKKATAALGGALDPAKSAFSGLGNTAKSTLDRMGKSTEPVKSNFDQIAEAAKKAGRDMATAMQQAMISVDALIARQREQRRASEDNVRSIEDQIEMLKLQLSFETDPQRRAEMALRLKQLEEEKSQRLEAAQEQKDQHDQELSNLERETALKLKALKDESDARLAELQARADAEREQAQRAAQAAVEAEREVLSRPSNLSHVKEFGDSVIQATTQAATQAASDIQKAFSQINILEPLSGQLSTLIQKFGDLAQIAATASRSINALGSGAGGGGGGGGEIPPFAGGGLFRGRSGRDSNLAWLSNLEYVMRPEAVKRYGVNFMHMINSMQFPGFAMGGLNLREPAYAGGGAARAGNTRVMHLTIGDQTFRNLIAPESTAKQLERASIIRQTSSTGIKPSWKR